MEKQHQSYTLSYLPVAWEYQEIIKTLIQNKAQGKVFYFNTENTIDETVGQVMTLTGDSGAGLFVTMDNGVAVRIDRIITICGKLGAAYDEYNNFSVCGANCGEGS
ncbi:hypothetical protein [Sphingobacterium corticibacter]|uniref:Uncharacterized protein n=1 Tax=Sphingobacterium corticibacter TaxID=2171749 RepID=A0A2T8HP07_9SPHI|nr:hypothetical protein [Sphingobacterium corticibacter]PVH27042.1 hypothetical protein DC487_05445 [Sphingobacterium corticibacter]